MTDKEFELAFTILRYALYFLAGCFLLIIAFLVFKHKVRIEFSKIKNMFFNEKPSSNGHDKNFKLK